MKNNKIVNVFFRSYILLTFSGVLALCTTASSRENYSDWESGVRIQLNTTRNGVLIADTITNFPLLIRLDRTNLRHSESVKDSCSDIRFTNKYNKKLVYEIERGFNQSEDNAVIWVKVDSLYPDDSTQYIYMHWGNNQVSDSSSGSQVFSSPHGFSGVYHLAEDDNPGIGHIDYYKDATGEHHGTDSILLNTDNSGFIGKGHKFGQNDFISLGSWNPSARQMTISAWVNWNGDTTKAGTIISKSDDNTLWTMYWKLSYSINSGSLAFNDGSKRHTFGKSMIESATWHHVSIVSRNGINKGTSLFVDGNKIDTSVTSSWGRLALAKIRIGNKELKQGQRAGWNGYIDEVRIENTARSDEWIRLCYENQRSEQRLYTIGTPPSIMTHPSDVTASSGDTVSFSVSVADSTVTYQWFRSNDSTTWSPVSEMSNSSVYSFVAQITDDQSFYRCVIICPNGKTTSRTASLAILKSIIIAVHPEDALNVVPMRMVTFSISAAGDELLFQWEKSLDDSTWSAIAGANGTSYSFTAQSNDRPAAFRCKISSGSLIIYSRAAKFSVRPEPEEPSIILFAKALNSGSIALSWTSKGSFERIRIYYSDHDTIPYEVEINSMNTIIPQVDSTSIVVTQLKQNTRYYFGAQIYSNHGWTRINKLSSATDSTHGSDEPVLVNSIKIQSAYFDTIQEKLVVVWNVDSSIAPDLQIGISYITEGNDVGISTIFQVVDVIRLSDSSVINFREPVIYSNDYTILLRLRRSNKEWTDVTSLSKSVVRIPCFRKKIVVFDFSNIADTMDIANNTIRIITPAVKESEKKNTQSTIEAFLPDPLLMRGFIAAGNGFKFTDAAPLDSLTIGFRSVVPAGFSIGDVRIYRYNGSSWNIEHSSFTDSGNAYTYVKTDRFNFPFLALVDTQPPLITIQGKSDTVIMLNQGFEDTVNIQDNIANSIWTFNCARGKDSWSNGSSSTPQVLSNTAATIKVATSKEFTGSISGVRAKIKVFDGRTNTVLDLSRRVRIENCGQIITEPMKWVPIKVTATLDTPSICNKVLSLRSSEGIFSYNPNKFRLFRWYPLKKYESGNQWVEYSPEYKDVFSLISGNLIWIKTKERETLQFGMGLSVSLKDAYVLTLNPCGWTDFANPFPFDIQIGSVLNETIKHHKNADSLQFYMWVQDNSNRFSTFPLFLSQFSGSDLCDGTKVLHANGTAGFSVWNPATQPISLYFPPVPVSESELKKNYKQLQDPDKGYIKISASINNGMKLTPVYCGINKNAFTDQYYPKPPSFDQVSINITDGTNGSLYGHAIKGTAGRSGSMYFLVLTNNDTATVELNCAFEKLGPSGLTSKAILVNTHNKKDIYHVENNQPITLTIKEKSTDYYCLMTGTDSFIDGSYSTILHDKCILQSLYPNPIQRKLMVKYALSFASLSKIKFTILNMSGKVIWQHSDNNLSSAYGTRNLQWNVSDSKGTSVAPGMYLFTMELYDLDGIRSGSFLRKIMIIR